MPDFRDELVRDVMSSGVTTTTPEAPLSEVVRGIYDEDVSCYVVRLEDPANGFGIVTQKDLLAMLAEVGADFEGLTVADVMTHPMVMVPPTFNLRTCMLHMLMHGVRRAAVLEQGELVGLITFTDIFRRAVESGRRGGARAPGSA